MKSLLAILAVCLLAAPVYAAEEPPELATLRQSAEQGNRDSQLELGILYEFGYRMPDNLVPALAWYLRAAEQGNEQAAKRRDALMGSMKASEVEEAKKLAAEIAGKQSTARSPAPVPAEPPAAAPPVAAEPAPQAPEPAAADKPVEPKPQ
jgi:localization factor PodJL